MRRKGWSAEVWALHSEMQGALLRAIHGLEQHIQDLFAQWNHGDLLQHAEELLAALSAESVSTDAATQQTRAAQAPAQADGGTAAEGSSAERSRPEPSALHDESLCDSGRNLTPGSALPKESVGGNANEGQSSRAGMHSSAAQPPSSEDMPSTSRQNSAQLPEEDAQPQQEITVTSVRTAEKVAQVRDSDDAPATHDCSNGRRVSQAAEEHETSRPDSTGVEGLCTRLRAALAEPLSPAMALAALAAVHAGAASLGLAASVGRMSWPLYLIGTRDSFTHHLHAECSRVSSMRTVGCFWGVWCMQQQRAHAEGPWRIGPILPDAGALWRPRVHEDRVLLPSPFRARQLL